jgi:hypothetical protein
MIALTINLPKPEMFELRLRIPRFCEEASVKLPQEDEAVTVKGGDWAVFNRTWQNDDTVMLRIPMKLRLVRGRRAQSGRVAVMYGPLVFCLSRQGHADLKDIDLRLITINPETLEGPFPDETVHPGGVACRVKAWAPGAWYPQAPPSYTLKLTEFADPTGEATYFHVPNPYDPAFVEDELIGPPKDESP